MLDEVEVPKSPRLFICPCCIFSYRDHGKFIAHCEKMKAQIDAAMVASREPKK